MTGKIKQIEELQKVLLKVANDRAFQNALAVRARRLIWERTKRGYGVDDDQAQFPKEKKLKELSPGYIEKRKSVRLGEFGSPAKSNLTFKGEMLKSIEIKITKSGFNLFINKKKRPDGYTNFQVSELVREERAWFALTDKEIRILSDEATRELKQRVLRILK